MPLAKQLHKFNKIIGIVVGLILVSMFTPLSYQDYASPLKQLKNGVPADEIECREGHILVIRTNGNPACVTEKTAEKKGWILVNVVNTKPAVTDYREIHEVIINSIQMGSLDEPIILNVTMINHTPEIEKNFNLRIRTPNSFEVDESQTYYKSKLGVDSHLPRYSAFFGIDESPDKLNLENLTFYPTETGTYEMIIQNKTATERHGYYDIWFVIDESNSYWSYDEPIRPEASSKMSSLSEGSESVETTQSVQLTDSEVEEFLQELSVKHSAVFLNSENHQHSLIKRILLDYLTALQSSCCTDKLSFSVHESCSLFCET